MMKREHVFNDSVRLAIREDGFRVYIFNNLVSRQSLVDVSVADIKVVSVKGKFDFELLNAFSNLEMLMFMDVDMKDLRTEKLLELSELKRLELVDCFMPGDVDFSRLQQLEELDLHWQSNYCFSEPSTLKDIVLRKLNTENLSFLHCTSLERLEVIEGKISSLKGIGELPHLKALTLIRLKNISDLRAINLLPNIEYLDLRGIKSTIDLHLIMGLAQLKWLVLENCDSSLSLEGLSAHPSLKGVKILKRGKLSTIEKMVMSSFPDTKYGYFRSDDVRNRLTVLFRNSDTASKN